MDITLINYMKEQLELVSLAFKRYNYDKLPWEARLVGLMGPRGVGKSTLILQHIKSKSPEKQAKSLYVSADHSYFTTSTLIETANQFVREGGEWLYIDEVHKYEGRAIPVGYGLEPAELFHKGAVLSLLNIVLTTVIGWIVITYIPWFGAL